MRFIAGRNVQVGVALLLAVALSRSASASDPELRRHRPAPSPAAAKEPESEPEKHRPKPEEPEDEASAAPASPATPAVAGPSATAASALPAAASAPPAATPSPPASVSPVARSLVGRWRWTGDGFSAGSTLKVERQEANGALRGSLDGGAHYRVEGQLTGDTVTLKLLRRTLVVTLATHCTGTLAPGGARIEGSWQGVGSRGRLVLERID